MPIHNIEIRRALPHELGEILFLFDLFCEETEFRFSWLMEKEEAAQVGEAMVCGWIEDKENGVILVAIDDKRIVGTMGFGRMSNGSESAFGLHTYVTKSHRGAGIATKMHEEMEEELKKIGIKKMVASSPHGTKQLDILINTRFTPKSVILEKTIQ